MVGATSSAAASGAAIATQSNYRPKAANSTNRAESGSSDLKLEQGDNQLAKLRSSISALNNDNSADLNIDPTSGDRGLDSIVQHGASTGNGASAPGSLVDISI